MESDLRLTPASDGAKVRIAVPPLTEDRRKELARVCRGVGEDGKVAVRNLRREAVDQVRAPGRRGARAHLWGHAQCGNVSLARCIWSHTAAAAAAGAADRPHRLSVWPRTRSSRWARTT